jgi:prepilin-type N-terminal cleavage/methylation domain-containing protein
MRLRRGFTLIEIMISMTILLVIMGVAVQFMRRQTSAVTMETQRMDALANAEFAVAQIERELREAGAGVTDLQPMIVQLDRMAITFNANMISIDSGDVRAVYQTPDADPRAVRAMDSLESRPLPNSVPAQFYPLRNYNAAKGFPSGAETISYYLVPDAAATTDSTFTLFRRVNAMDSTLVARNIVKRDTVPFFTYFTQDTLGRLVPVSPARLPVYHSVTHGASTDTGRSAITDSIRAVRVHFVALTVDRRAGKDSVKYRVVESRIRLMNSGLLNLTSCGQPPLGVPMPTVTQTASGVSPRNVTVTWGSSNDDGMGEKDIERYAIFRRVAGTTINGDPIASIPAKGATSYSFVDSGAQAGATYVYGVAAQDCTPNVSDVSFSAPIMINP